MLKVCADNFEHWRRQARGLLLDAVEPAAVHWEYGAQVEMFGQNPAAVLPTGRKISVPAEFFALAEPAARFRDRAIWALLYRIAWRLVYENRHLLASTSDPDVRRLHRCHRAVDRDMHKMKAFVRFRSVKQDSSPDAEQFVAWYEPKHYIVAAVAPFFVARFTGMHWSLLTPDLCLHWDTQQLQMAPGMDKPALADDNLEEYWRRYYLSIFNPARTKPEAMRAQLPVYYWKNLPEAADIASLLRTAPQRVEAMLEAPPTEPDRLRNKSKRLRESQDRLRQSKD